ncbi:MAG: hypothetical protein JWQ40_2302 [Segetibacter sp.]|jgi:hypothetical protein|nr:hypothetical protein [Segetibacter sp.]
MTNTEINPAKVATQKKDFSAEVGEDIGYERGAKMVKNHFDKNGEASSHFIGRDIIEAILAQPGVVGISIHNGIDQFGRSNQVLVGVNSQGNYVLNITTISAGGELGKQRGIVTAGGVRSTGTQPCGWEW